MDGALKANALEPLKVDLGGASIYIYMHIHINTYIHTYINIYINIYIDPHAEAAISKFHGTADTILFPSCFDANAGLFEAANSWRKSAWHVLRKCESCWSTCIHTYCIYMCM